MNDEGKVIGDLHAMKEKGKNIKEAKIGTQIAASIDKAIVGRNIKEGDILFTYLTKEEYQSIIKEKNLLNDNEINILEEIREIMVKKDKLWDVV